MTNAFHIPKQSQLLVGKDKRHFTRVHNYKRNMTPIVLPGSSKEAEPKMMGVSNGRDLGSSKNDG